jgi:hypothetical protein
VSYAALSARRFTVAAIVTRREGIGGPTPVESVATVAPLLGQKAIERPRARHLTEATNSSGLSSSKHAPDQRFMSLKGARARLWWSAEATSARPMPLRSRLARVRERSRYHHLPRGALQRVSGSGRTGRRLSGQPSPVRCLPPDSHSDLQRASEPCGVRSWCAGIRQRAGTRG